MLPKPGLGFQDPHKQEFLRGHDADVSAIDLSLNGKLLASGQLGSPFRKGAVAPVVVWDFDNRSRYIDFNGLAHSVLCVRFSPDGRFLVATGANQMIFVWDVSTGEVVYNRRRSTHTAPTDPTPTEVMKGPTTLAPSPVPVLTESPCFLGVWGPILDLSSRYPSYQLCTTYDSQVLYHVMKFDMRSMCYTLESDAMQFPPSGLQRKHICGLVTGDFLTTGTSAGDLCVFNIKTKVFRTALPVCNNGVTSMAQSGDLLFVAGGDGRIKALRGFDIQWDVLAENMLDSGVTALTPSADGAELVAGSRNGKMWRLLSSDLTATLQSASHTGEVTDIAFGTRSDVLCTVSDTGEVFLLDLSDYMPITTAFAKSPVRTAVWSPNEWTMRASGAVERVVPIRQGVTVVRETANFVVTGGGDSAVRFWHRTSREMLSSFQNHRKPVADILLDEVSPHVVHSASEDKLVVTYDLKQNKALVQHTSPGGNITGISQRKDHDNEVVSCAQDGKLLFWDVDYPDPTGCIDGPTESMLRLRCCEISPNGRYIAAGSDDARMAGGGRSKSGIYGRICERMYIYDLVSCQCIQECEGHSGGITQVRWSPDQKQLISAGKDGCVILQSRSGARVQLSDLGLEEKIIEVTGPCRCVDTACSLLVVDLAHIQKLQVAGCKLGVRSAEVEVSALIPEALSQWAEEDLLAQHFDAGVEPEVSEEARDVAEISTAAAEAARARPSKRSRDVPELLMDLLGFAEVSGTRFRRLHLVGRPGNVSAALRAVRQRLRRFGRWKAANITELPAVNFNGRLFVPRRPRPRSSGEEVPELKNFVSTENVFLRLDAGLAARLSGPAAEVLAQIKEEGRKGPGKHDEAAGASCLEIAGTCSSKLRALVEICHLLLHLPQESPQVELWLRGEGPCAFTLEEALALAESTARAGHAPIHAESTTNRPRRPKRVVVQLSGSAAAVGASAVALWRESERKAWLHERKHGPPALLVDYFSRSEVNTISLTVTKMQRGTRCVGLGCRVDTWYSHMSRVFF
eukprot:g21591.t1